MNVRIPAAALLAPVFFLLLVSSALWPAESEEPGRRHQADPVARSAPLAPELTPERERLRTRRLADREEGAARFERHKRQPHLPPPEALRRARAEVEAGRDGISRQVLAWQTKLLRIETGAEPSEKEVVERVRRETRRVAGLNDDLRRNHARLAALYARGDLEGASALERHLVARHYPTARRSQLELTAAERRLRQGQLDRALWTDPATDALVRSGPPARPLQ